MIETYGTCMYCGQSQVIRVPEDRVEYTLCTLPVCR